MISRRRFLKEGLATTAVAIAAENVLPLRAASLALPLGLQLYSVRKLLATDYDGTLKQIASLGYREVEAAGFYDRTAAQVKQSMQEAGLRCVSAHYPYGQLAPKVDEVIAFGHELGLEYIICSSPGAKNPGGPAGAHTALTLDDWRWNADQFNQIGEKVKKAGLKFGYHNHTFEFHAENGVRPYDELLRLTDPSKVTLELDCGWVIVGGANPIDYLKHYPTRFSMLHVKDFKPAAAGSASAEPTPTELGRGTIDYKPIFAAASRGHIRHIFVEQEGYDVPVWDSLKIDADYIRSLKA
jgi:sugar phosphate isomerase/epimerase